MAEERWGRKSLFIAIMSASNTVLLGGGHTNAVPRFFILFYYYHLSHETRSVAGYYGPN